MKHFIESYLETADGATGRSLLRERISSTRSLESVLAGTASRGEYRRVLREHPDWADKLTPEILAKFPQTGAESQGNSKPK